MRIVHILTWRNEGVGLEDGWRHRSRISFEGVNEMMKQDWSDEMDEELSDLDGTWSRLETGEPGVRLRQKREWERES